MQLAKMIVLGSLEVLEMGSGYDIYQFLDKNQISRWTDIQKPSIYNALRQLEKECAIEQTKQIKVGKYPEKVVYQVNEKGRKLFDSLQEEAFLGIYPRFFGFKLALKFNRRRTLEEINHFGNKAISLIDEKLKDMDEYLESLPKNSNEWKRNLFFIDHDRRLYNAEKEWIKEALEQIKKESVILKNVL
ncbi:PadR family transcriptional regulator [Anaerosacchariphilus polymeriproducens]|nr:PadR family transcriptional regulator [Anaerosacchariphilus polymeriproducens]